MDSMAAMPGTGPSTGPMSVVRKVSPRGFNDLPTGRTLVMGILNVTPNSFSDGGQHLDVDSAIEHGLRMYYAGADIVDVGGESTAPGNEEVDAEEEQRRILPVIQALIKAGVVVSVDTRHASTARAALEYGDVIINDVSGLGVEQEMLQLVAESGAYYIVMHNRGNSQTMDSLAEYDDLVGDVCSELQDIITWLQDAGASPNQLIVDPGLGFSKVGEQNWKLLKNLDAINALGYPVLVAASRKRFLGLPLADSQGQVPEFAERDDATAAVSTLSAQHGAWAVRVHTVEASADAVRIAAAWSADHDA